MIKFLIKSLIKIIVVIVMKNFSVKQLSALPLLAVMASMSVLPACSLVSVYKIDIPQGTPIKAEQLAQVQGGMTQNQVLYLLGSPAVRDTLNPNRWDYIYDYTAGTNGKKKNIANVHNAKQYAKIYFDQSGLVSHIEK